jgi:hypothetical protein
MATYVPGIPSYMPTWKTFTPDYKFLSDVLETKTNRYNTNHKAINDRYSKVVYADLSREDTNNLRDQYANNLGAQMQKIAGIDLSVMQNADAAKALFKPFYDEDIIVKDLIHTKNLAIQQRQAEAMRTSLDPEIRRRYWPTGMEVLQYKHQDFINATEKEALAMPLQKYVPDADLYNMTMKYLEKQGYNVTLPSESPDGKWIIKTTNGAVITKQALADATAALADDPLVQKAYEAQAYVSSRRYADKAVADGTAASITDGMTQWGKNEIEKNTKQVGIKVAELNKQKAILLTQKEEWDKYEKENGIIPGSQQDINRSKLLSALDATSLNITRYTDAVQESAQLIADGDDAQIRNRGYNILMANNIQGDLSRAALMYSEKTKKVEFEVNQYKLNEIKFDQSVYLKRLGHQHRKSEIRLKQKLENEANNLNNEANTLFDTPFGDAATITAPDGIDADVVNDYFVKSAQKNEDLIADETAILGQILNAEGNGGANNMYTLDGMWEGGESAQTEDGWQTKVSGRDLQKVLANPANREALNSFYEKKLNEYKKPGDNLTPQEKARIIKFYPELKELMNERLRQEWTDGKVNEKLYGNWQQLIKEETDKFLLGLPNEFEERDHTATFHHHGVGMKRAPINNAARLEHMAYKTAIANSLFKMNEKDEKGVYKKPKLRTEEEYVNYFMKEYPDLGNKVKTVLHDSKIGSSLEWTWFRDKPAPVRTTDDAEVKEYLKEQYTKYTEILNSASTGKYNTPVTAENTEGAANRFEGVLYDDIYQGDDNIHAGDMILYPSIPVKITPGRITSRKQIEIYKALQKQLNYGLENEFYSGGMNVLGETTIDKNTALSVLNAVQDHLKQGSGSGVAQQGVDIYYNKGTAVSGDVTSRKAAYTIDIPKHILDGITATGNKTNTLKAEEMGDYRQITIAFPIETDMSPYSIDNQEFSYVKTRLNASKTGSFADTIPNGGDITIRELGGQPYADVTMLQYGKGGENNEYGMWPMSTFTQPLEGTSLNWDETLKDVERLLMAKAMENTEAQTRNNKKHKLEK